MYNYSKRRINLSSEDDDELYSTVLTHMYYVCTASPISALVSRVDCRIASKLDRYDFSTSFPVL